MPPYIKVLAINIRNLQKNKIDIILDMAICQANANISQSIEIHNLFINLKREVDSNDILNDNQIEILNTLEELIFFIL